MDKPILIDALHICMGGGLMILNHLVNNLVEQNVDFVLLKDIRCPRLQAEKKVAKMEILSSDSKTRNAYYKAHRNDFRTVLCFGNIPAEVRMPVTVYTYIHNVSLLSIPNDYNWKQRIKSWLKKIYIRHYSKNTDAWIVQTSNTSSLVKKHLVTRQQPIYEFPFYHIPADINRVPASKRSDYVFIGEHTGAKGHEYLVEAWIGLARKSLKPTLHLTVTDEQFCTTIENANKLGAHIVNHGHISFDEVIDLYNQSKATIYPSLNESLGLGIIEAIEAGCDVIGCDLPYIHSICRPSETFAPRSPESIVNAVMRYENAESKKSVLTIKDEVNSFVKFLCHVNNN